MTQMREKWEEGRSEKKYKTLRDQDALVNFVMRSLYSVVQLVQRVYSVAEHILACIVS